MVLSRIAARLGLAGLAALLVLSACTSDGAREERRFGGAYGGISGGLAR